HLSKSTLTYTTSETVLVGTNVNDQSDIRVLAGNFDSDNQDEIIVAYKSTDNKLHIEYYDTNGTLIPVLKAHIEDETLVSSTSPNDWGIAVHDLDGDNKDEIIVGFRPATPGQGVFAKVYKVDSTTIVPKARKLIDNAALTSKTNAVTVAVSAGDYDKDGKPELALAWGRIDSCGGNGCGDSFIYPLKIGDDKSTATKDSLEVITFNPANRAVVSLSPNSLSALNLQSGDLNADGRDEIVLAGNQGAEFFEADNNLKLTNKGTGGYSSGDAGYTTDFLRVGDIDGKPGDEVITMSHSFDSDPSGQQSFSLSILTFDANLNASGLASKNNFLSVPTNGSENTHRHYAIATGDFNGDNFRIGEGTKYVKTDIMQPIVILNAPPTHFDVLNGKTYDINSCYNANLANCSQTATYFKSTSETQMINTEIHSDWGVSSTLSGEASYLGVSVKAHLTATYGEKFSNTQNSSTTVNVSTQITASGDDLIYATVCDYEIWKYPVITANNTKSGYILAVVPKLTENRWFPSKERSADGYVPKHEVGNILSYTPYSNLNNPDEAQMLQGSYLQGSTDLNESTNATFEVNLTNTFSNETTRQKDIGLEVGGSVGGWGIELSGTATYNQGEISTHTTTVESSVDAKVHLGPIDRSLGEDNFNVTPYVYWANNGALVIDYAARAILPSAGGTATWWSDNYGKQQDPAFILPWRLDPEKGLALQDNARRQQTKSISFEPREPKVGDTVTITALVNNFSLKQTEDSVPVSFYMGDPNSGGTLLTSIDGKTLFKTPGIIPAQGFLKVSMKWKRPATTDAFPRIYAYIDPQNKMTEIHEDNNIGWTVLGNSS
ncbi:MAG TPA: VCBS repeat-containing protein, partial [Bacteroidales bacterium]